MANKSKGAKDLTHLITKNYEGKWVALSPRYNKVLGSSRDLAKLSKKMAGEKVVYMKAIPSTAYHSF